MCVCVYVCVLLLFLKSRSTWTQHWGGGGGGGGRQYTCTFSGLDCARADMKVCSAKPNILLTNKIVAITVSEAFVNIVLK